MAAEPVTHLISQIAGADNRFPDAAPGKCFKLMGEEGAASNWCETLWDSFKDWPQPRSQPTRENQAGWERIGRLMEPVGHEAWLLDDCSTNRA